MQPWRDEWFATPLRSASALLWRGVEAQHRVATLRLVDSLEDQATLERLLETSKPPLPEAAQGLHYLLATPFRYSAVYPHGSRFRRAGRTLGVYYAALTVETALAEMAFYRLLFFSESPATPLPGNAADYTAFSAAVATEKSIDLTRPRPTPKRPLSRPGLKRPRSSSLKIWDWNPR